MGRLIERYFLPLSLLSWLWGWAFYAGLYLRDGRNPFLWPEGDLYLGTIRWKATQYYVNYFDHGFVRRGVIGTLFHQVPPDKAALGIALLSLLGGGLAIWLFHRFFRATLAAVPAGNRGLIHLLMVVVAVSPFGMMQIGYDVGRYDVWGILVLLLAAGLLLQGRRIAALALGLPMLFIHEGFALWGMPVILAMAFLQEHRDRPVGTPGDLLRALAARPLSASLLFALGTAALVLVLRAYGGSEAVSSLRMGNGHVVWVGDSIGLGEVLSPMTHLLLAGIGLLYLGAVWALARANPGRAIVIGAVCLAPLLLYVAGSNWARFAHLQFVTLVVFGALLSVEDPSVPRFAGLGRVALWAVVLLAPLGPIGITEAFPYLRILMGLSG